MSTALIIPDVHVPFEDPKAYELLLHVARDLKPKEIVLLGDFCDFYSISSHPKDPDMDRFLVKEIESVIKRLDELDKLFPKANKVYLEGNHENRLDRFIRDKAPEIFGCISLEKLLCLDQRKDWKWIPYGPYQKHRVLNSKLFARHEPFGTGAKTTVTRAMGSVVFGHIHRIEDTQAVAIDGTIHTAFCPGWLGDKSKKPFQFLKTHAQWGLGFAILHVNHKHFSHEIIRVINNTCFFRGKLYK